MAKKIKTLHRWTCPHEKVFLLKAETILLAVLIFLVFIFSFFILDQRWLPTAIITAFFILIFFLLTHLSRIIYPLKEIYQLTHSGISITSQTGKKTQKTHLPYKDIKNFKLDRLFHGGRIETKTKHYPLYFNTLKEIQKLEKILEKKVKKK